MHELNVKNTFRSALFITAANLLFSFYTKWPQILFVINLFFFPTFAVNLKTAA